MFKIMDDNGDKKLDLYVSFLIFSEILNFISKEFKKGMRDFGCEVTSDEAAEMFYAFDKDNSGHVSFDELLTALR